MEDTTSSEVSRRAQIWEQLNKDINRRAREGGSTLDHGINDLVISLNAIGIKTDMSCEGHLTYAVITRKGKELVEWSNPWISFVNGPPVNDGKFWPLASLIQDFNKARQIPVEARIGITVNDFGFANIFCGRKHELDAKDLSISEAIRKGEEELKTSKREIQDFGAWLKSKYIETGLQL
jgi:hypothetical protein